MELQKHQDLLWLEELEKRGGLTADQQRELNYKRLGFRGEDEFGQLMRRYMPSDWQLLQDVRLKTIAGEIQMDAVLLNNLGLSVFEVKNYTADYHYSAGRWQVNGRPKHHDDFQQLERTAGLLTQQLQRNGFNLPVHQYVVYINEEDTVEIDDESLPFIKRAKLRRFINLSIDNCQSAPYQTYPRETEWLLSQHQPDDRRLTLSDGEFTELKKGIYCVNCHSFELECDRYHVHCRSCRYSESKEKAIVRTICDYGILFPYRGLTPIELARFMEPSVPYKNLFFVLSKHFVKQPNKGQYINPQSSFKTHFPNLAFHYKDKAHPDQI